MVQGDCYPCSLKHGLFSVNPPFSKVGMFPRGSGAEDAATSVLGALEAEPGPREPREATARGGRLIQVQPHHPRGSGGGKALGARAGYVRVPEGNAASSSASSGSGGDTAQARPSALRIPQRRLCVPEGTLLATTPGSCSQLAGTAAGSQELGPY